MSHARVALLAWLMLAHSSTFVLLSSAPIPKNLMTNYSPLGMKFVRLTKATTYIGWNGEKGSAKKTEIKEDFEIAVYTVTQGQWTELMNKNPSYFSREGKGKNKVKGVSDDDLKQFPVENVSWHDCQEFVKKLNEKAKGNGYVYRLPTEEEWEYACRGGATTEEGCSYHFYFKKPTNDISSKLANFNGDDPFGNGELGPNLKRTTKVGSYEPNKLGLYDMHGNVLQWTSTTSEEADEDSYWVVRGCSYLHDGSDCRAAYRITIPSSYRFSTFGLRLVRVRER